MEQVARTRLAGVWLLVAAMVAVLGVVPASGEAAQSQVLAALQGTSHWDPTGSSCYSYVTGTGVDTDASLVVDPVVLPDQIVCPVGEITGDGVGWITIFGRACGLSWTRIGVVSGMTFSAGCSGWGVVTAVPQGPNTWAIVGEIVLTS